MDVFGKMREEHKVIISRVVDLIGSDPKNRRDRMDDLAVQIIAHMDAEEKSIYRAFEELDAVPRSLALRLEEEHLVARFMMNGLFDRGIADEYWVAKLQVFREVLEHHMESEERTMFDMAKDYFEDDEIQRMTKQFEEAETGLFKESRIGPLVRP